MNTNLKGLSLLAAVVKTMMRQRYGRIVIVTSVVGVRQRGPVQTTRPPGGLIALRVLWRANCLA